MTTINAQKSIDSDAKKRQELEEALRYYCRFHLKTGDLEKFPELKNYLD